MIVSNDKNKVTSPKLLANDKKLDLSLRPKDFSHFIGQAKIKENLRILTKAAKQRKEPIEHVLLYGPPGIGKTTLANIIAKEMNANIRITSGPAIEKSGDLASILTNLEDHDIIFIDEIHRMNRIVEETLYPAMEDYCLDIMIGKGPSAKTLRLDLPKFTIIGATTRIGLLTSPLRDRFGATYRLDFYNDKEIEEIVLRSAEILRIKLDPPSAEIISKRARKTPRIANRILKRVRDFAEVKAKGEIDSNITNLALQMLDIDNCGLDETDRKILLTIIEKFNNGPVGIETISAATSEERDTIEEVNEPYLLQCGFLARTPKGRIATRLAYEHLGIKFKQDKLI